MIVSSACALLQDGSGRDAAFAEKTNNTGLALLLEQHLQAVVWFQKEIAKELSTDSPRPASTDLPGQ